jgi:hypothetical protein
LGLAPQPEWFRTTWRFGSGIRYPSPLRKTDHGTGFVFLGRQRSMFRAE